jgi:hypothetical protein
MSLTTLQKEMDEVKTKVAHLERILIIGDGDRLPLAEVVRALTKTVSDYIAQKDKEEQRKKEDWNRIKWIVIGIVVPALIAFLGQAIIFYFRVVPIIEGLST